MAERFFKRAEGVDEAVAACHVARDMADTAKARALPARYQEALDEHPDYPPAGLAWIPDEIGGL